jgi:hypothetical protein
VQDKYKLLECVWSCILKPKTKVMIVSPTVLKKNEAYESTLKLLSTDMCDSTVDNSNILFINGSSITFVAPKKPGEVIRGHRSQMPLYSNEDLDLYGYQKRMLDMINNECDKFIVKDDDKDDGKME